MLLHMSEDQAFDMLKFLMYDLGFRRQYKPDMVSLQVGRWRDGWRGEWGQGMAGGREGEMEESLARQEDGLTEGWCFRRPAFE